MSTAFQNVSQGREAAVQLVENMNEGFQKMPISDPNKLKTFIEGTTGRQLRWCVVCNVNVSRIDCGNPEQPEQRALLGKSR